METHELIQLIRDNKLMKFYKSREWRELRLKALKRDNFECCMCRDKGSIVRLIVFITSRK